MTKKITTCIDPRLRRALREDKFLKSADSFWWALQLTPFVLRLGQSGIVPKHGIPVLSDRSYLLQPTSGHIRLIQHRLGMTNRIQTVMGLNPSGPDFITVEIRFFPRGMKPAILVLLGVALHLGVDIFRVEHPFDFDLSQFQDHAIQAI